LSRHAVQPRNLFWRAVKFLFFLSFCHALDIGSNKKSSASLRLFKRKILVHQRQTTNSQ
jgi:hypothetical protein